MTKHPQPSKPRYLPCRFFNQPTSPELLATLDDLLPEHRERYYPPTETLSMFLAQALSADRSCQYVVNHALVQRVFLTGACFTAHLLAFGLPLLVCPESNCRYQQRHQHSLWMTRDWLGL